MRVEKMRGNSNTYVIKFPELKEASFLRLRPSESQAG